MKMIIKALSWIAFGSSLLSLAVFTVMLIALLIGLAISLGR